MSEMSITQKPTKSRIKTLAKIEQKTGLEAALAYNDTVSSIRAVNDTIKEKWVGYVDPAGNKASSPNSFMTLRKHWNRKFGISSVKELIGDVERSLLYALANHRANRAIQEGVKQERLRPEIREATYDEFEKAKAL
jgi:hypothetical protein